MPPEGAELVVRVRVEAALPPAGTATWFGRLTPTPEGATPFQAAVRLTEELKPSTDDRTIVTDCDWPAVNHTTVGEGGVTVDVIEKSGLAGAKTVGVPVIVTCMAVEWDIAPLVAVTISVKLPVEGELPAVRVRIEEALPPGRTVTGLRRLTATPLGVIPDQASDRLREELKPLTDEKTNVLDSEVPGVNVITAGAGWVMKSGAGTDVETTVPAGTTVT